MTELWRAIEESPLLMDVKDVWRERLGKDFEPLSRFLERRILSPQDCRSHSMVLIEGRSERRRLRGVL